MSEVEAAILFLYTNRKVIFGKIENVIRSSSYEPVKMGQKTYMICTMILRIKS